MLHHANDKVLKAAERFLVALNPAPAWHNARYGALDKCEKAIADLVVCAFWLYDVEWGENFDIRDWEWPHRTLRERSDFAGNEPWSVLFARAIKLNHLRAIANQR